MGLVKIGRRVEVNKAPARCFVWIKPRKAWPTLFVLPFWFVGWTGMGGLVMAMFLQRFDLFFGIWLLVWLLTELAMVFEWFWNAFGQEELTIENGMVTYRRALLSYRVTKTFPQHNLKNLRAVGCFDFLSFYSPYYFHYSFTQRGLTGGTVAFEWQDETYRFGMQLPRQEAQWLVNELRGYLATAA